MDDKKHPNQPQLNTENHQGKTPADSLGGHSANTGISGSMLSGQRVDAKVDGDKPQVSKHGKGDHQDLSGLVPKSFPRRLFSKRWAYPAIYLGAAAVIIGLMYVRTQSGAVPATSPGVDTGSTSTSQTAQTASSQAAVSYRWPVVQGTQVKVTLGFFNPKGTAAEQAAALVSYDGGYYAHKGYDIQASNQQSFAVVAATSGKVVAVVNDPLKGQTVEIASSDGYTERYESLSSVKVKQGETVQTGQELGMSGTCQFEQAAGDHLYFAIYKGTTAVDPGTLLPKL